MNMSIHARVKTLIQDTNDAYFASGVMNADYAEFASLAISEFKSALKNPALTRPQLIRMLRGGLTLSRQEGASDWTHFLAVHMAETANAADAGSAV